MSDDYHRPTLTFPNNAYNATQVRLYGIKATGGLSFAGNPTSLGDTGVNVSVGEEMPADAENYQKAKNILKEYNNDPVKIFNAISTRSTWWPPIPTKFTYQLAVEMKSFGTVVVSTAISLKNALEDKPLSAGIVVGYSYEGHCYDLPKPKVMLIRALPVDIPLDDCGYDAKSANDYKVWIVDKLDQCIEFEMNQGFIEQLVLEANLPGKRSPNMYAGRIGLAHRGGRLSE